MEFVVVILRLQQKLISVIWDSWFKLWGIRNGEVRGTTAATRIQAQHREVNWQLTEIILSQEFMEPQVWELLDVDQEAQMQRPQRGLTESWLTMVGPVIGKSVQRVKRVTLQGVRLLRSYHILIA